MTHAAPLVSTVLVNWNGTEDTLNCIESLKTTCYPNHKIIVVDNGSSDQFICKLELQEPYITLIRNSHNLGYGQACNQGISLAVLDGSKYVFLLNNDAVINESTISELVETLEIKADAAITGSVMHMQSLGKCKNPGRNA